MKRPAIVISIGLAASALAACGSSSSGGASGTSVSPAAAASKASSCPAADGSSPKKQHFSAAPGMCIDPSRAYTATMTTDAGPVVITLDATKAPKTVNNFVVLARYHFYDGVTFHRVIPGFMAQGGDPEGTGQGRPGYEIPDELPKPGEYEIGSIAMANTGQANTGGSQFFIITGPNGTSLPPKYALFGKVTKGMDVVKRIEADGSSPSDGNGTPKKTHTIEKVTISGG